MSIPPEAYSGSEPFVFVCYAHADKDEIYPELARLSEAGFKLWYDDGITPGSEWTASIANAIERCSAFMFFVSPRSVESEHCRREITFGLEENRPMLAVHLEETRVPGALRLSLSHRQALMKYRDPRYEGRVVDALRGALAGEEPGMGGEVEIGEATLNIDQRLLRIDGTTQQLDPKDVSVLLHLVEAAPQVVTTDALLGRSWPGAVVGDNALQQVIGRLRKSFGDDARNPRVIETIPRQGYRLMVSVGEGLPSEDGAAERAVNPTRSSWMWIVALVAAISIAVGLATFFSPDDSAPSESPRRIVLLPFEDLNPRDDFDVADDISTSVRNHLARLEGVEMIAKRSAEIAAASDADVTEIADELNVRYVITGEVIQRDDQIRVSVQLLDGVSGVDIGSAEVRKVVAATADYFDLYDEIAGRVSGAFPFEFQSASVEVSGYEPPREAYERVARAYRGSDSFEVIFELLDEAIEIDPNYPQAYAVRSMYKGVQAELRFVRPIDGFLEARQDAETALRLDPNHPLALAMQASMYDRIDLDWPRAFRGYREALLNGALAFDMAWYQDTLTNAGLFSIGLAHTTEAERLNPFSAFDRVASARFLWRMGRHDEAIAKMEEALRIDKTEPMIYDNAFNLFFFYAKDYERSRQLISEVQATESFMQIAKARLSNALGDPEPLRATLRSLESADGYIDSLVMFIGYWELGDYWKHLTWTRIRIEDRANVGWLIDNQRSSPDYWPELEAWAEGSSDRMAALKAHRELIEDATKNMYVPEGWTPY